MKKVNYLLILLTTTFVFSCESKVENQIEYVQMSKPKVITIIYSDGHKQHFCPKAEGSTTYLPCPKS